MDLPSLYPPLTAILCSLMPLAMLKQQYGIDVFVVLHNQGENETLELFLYQITSEKHINDILSGVLCFL